MQRENMSNTGLEHKHRQGSPHTQLHGLRGGFTQHQVKLNMATMGTATLPLVENTTQTHT